MAYKQLNRDYEKGKQVICLSTIIISIVGLALDALTYHSIYSVSQIWLQCITVLLCVTSLIYFLVNRNKYYVFAFSLISYTIIVNIFFTTIYIHTFISFENFNHANILSRDLLFVLLYVVLGGFLLGRIHIFIQGSMLVSLILYFILILKDKFFVENAPIYLVAFAAFIASLYFFVGTLNRLIEGLEESIVATNDLKKIEIRNKQALIQYQNALLILAKDESLFRNDQAHLFNRICEAASQNLKSSRASIWMLEENNSRLVRKHLYELEAVSDERIFLERKAFPQYFEALETKPFISANNAFEHPDTIEFKDVYLKPLSIFSMLDCPIVIDGAIVGVICCENQRMHKEWSTEDILFIQSLSGHISLFYKKLEINNLLNQVRQRNAELEEKGNQIELINEELNSVNEELKTLNETLEETVLRRTSELATQNKQLTEYAFINSHILRAPLARILGLANLISAESIPVKDKRLIEALITSSNELDIIITKISDLLYDGNNLSRTDVQTIIDRNINKSA